MGELSDGIRDLYFGETRVFLIRWVFPLIRRDEAHHAGSSSYQAIMNYFQPKFWLGMTASPDTNQYDIYAIFDHNIAYDLRLNQALEEDLVCPFHYYGITDLEIDGEAFDDQSNLRNFSRLVSDERVDHVIEQASFYGYSGERVKGIVFCRSKEEARELSVKFNERGFRTVEYDYPSFHLSMDCFWCELAGDHVILKEHEAARWLCAEELDDVDWLPADLQLIDEISLTLKAG